MAALCPNCNHPAVEGAVYCIECGAKLRNLCPACNTLNPFGSKFCYGCGSSLSSESAGRGAQGPPRVDVPALPSACPRCGSVNEPGSAYCFSCGLPLDERTAPAPSFAAGVPAGFWIRVLALVIDGVILGVVGIVVTLVTLGILEIILGAVYYTVAVSAWSTTIGKRLLGLYVLRPDGSKVGPGRAFARYWAYAASTFLLFVGYLMVAFREDKRALHDLMCNTVVVRRK